jgi:hypothetical protein
VIRFTVPHGAADAVAAGGRPRAVAGGGTRPHPSRVHASQVTGRRFTP